MVRIMAFAAGALLAGTVGAVAQGSCPSGLARDGVWVDFPDRSVLTRVLSDGRIHEMEFARDGTYLNIYITSALGLVEQSWALNNGQAAPDEVERMTYAGTPPTMPAPVAGARFDGIVTSVFGSEAPVRSSINLVVGQPQPVVIGACSYTGLPVDVIRIEMGGGTPERDSMLHLTELGLTIYLGFAEGDAPAQDALPLSISLDPPAPAGATSGFLPPPLPGAPDPDAGK